MTSSNAFRAASKRSLFAVRRKVSLPQNYASDKNDMGRRCGVRNFSQMTGSNSNNDSSNKEDGVNDIENKKTAVTAGQKWRGMDSNGRTSMMMFSGQIFPFSSLLFEGGKVVIGIATFVLAGLYWNQEKMLYIPEMAGVPRSPSDNPPGYRNPAEYDIPFENLMIPSHNGVSVHAWLLLQQQNIETKNMPTIVFFHGNAGNIGMRLPNAAQMYSELKANILMVEYRGYGDSDDIRPSEDGIRLDAEAVFHFLQKHPAVDSNRLFVFGRSLGGAVGFHLAQYAQEQKTPLVGLMVENTFCSINRMVDILFPWIPSPLKWLLLRIRWKSDEIAPMIRVPVLYLAGDNDEIVPHDQMLELYEKSTQSSMNAAIHIIKGGMHNDSWIVGGRQYYEAMNEFMTKALALVDKGGGGEEKSINKRE